MKFEDYNNRTGYNFCFRKSKYYDLDKIEQKLKEAGDIDYIRTGYGIFFKNEQYYEVMDAVKDILNK